jgi:hypothetical protein
VQPEVVFLFFQGMCSPHIVNLRHFKLLIIQHLRFFLGFTFFFFPFCAEVSTIFQTPTTSTTIRTLRDKTFIQKFLTVRDKNLEIFFHTLFTQKKTRMAGSLNLRSLIDSKGFASPYSSRTFLRLYVPQTFKVNLVQMLEEGNKTN